MGLHGSNGLGALRMVRRLELVPRHQRDVKIAHERAGACYKRLCGSSQSAHLQQAAFLTYFRAKLLLQTWHLNGFSSV